MNTEQPDNLLLKTPKKDTVPVARLRSQFSRAVRVASGMPGFRQVRRRIKKYIDSEITFRLSQVAELQPYSESSEQDIFIVGHPKSGTTWFQQLVAGAVYGVDVEFAPFSLIRDLVPGHLQRYYKRYGTPTFFKSHDLPQQRQRRVIYLVRDGRDVMVSYYHHLTATTETETDFMDVVQSKVRLWPYKWHEHVEAWLANPFDAQMLMIKYEDLQRDPVKELNRFCRFAGYKRRDSFLQQVVTKSSFEKMRRKEATHGVSNPNWQGDSSFMRRGQVGSHKDEMSPEVLSRFLKDAEATLGKCGYL